MHPIRSFLVRVSGRLLLTANRPNRRCTRDSASALATERFTVNKVGIEAMHGAMRSMNRRREPSLI
jgi:hypothetical protein